MEYSSTLNCVSSSHHLAGLGYMGNTSHIYPCSPILWGEIDIYQLSMPRQKYDCPSTNVPLFLTSFFAVIKRAKQAVINPSMFPSRCLSPP